MVDIRCKDVTFQNIRAVFFDKDGTLALSESFLRSVGQRRSRLIDAQIPGVQEPLLMAFGLNDNALNPAGLLAVGTRHENEIAAAAYVAETGRDWLESLTLVRSAFQEADHYMQRKAEQTPLVEGGLNLIKSLFERGLVIGILSSDTLENVNDFAKFNALEPYVKVQVGANIAYSKPDPKILLEACSIAQVEPSETLVIGDSAADIALARAGLAAGCVGVNWGWTRRPLLSDADAVLTHVEQLEIIN